jgi:cytochrome b561
LPASIPAWQRFVAAATHALLYVLMIAIPLTGWLYSSSSGIQTVYLGLVPLPDLVGKDKEVADLFKFMHENLNYTMLVLVIAHAAAGLKHHFVDHDGVLKRMLPFLK